MNTPGFWREVGIGLLLSAVGAVLMAALAPLLGTPLVLRAVLCLLAAAYLLLLLHALRARAGRLLAVAAFVGLCGALLLVNPPAWLWLGAMVGLVWLVRSLYRYASLGFAAADAVLSGLALCAALAAAAQTHGVFLSLWSFFLVQALWVLIPTGRPPNHPQHIVPSASEAAFDRAYRTAEDALERLAAGR